MLDAGTYSESRSFCSECVAGCCLIRRLHIAFGMSWRTTGGGALRVPKKPKKARKVSAATRAARKKNKQKMFIQKVRAFPKHTPLATPATKR